MAGTTTPQTARAYVRTPFQLRVESGELGERSATVSRMEEHEAKALHLSTTVSFRQSATAPANRKGLSLDDDDFDFDSKTATPETYSTDAALLQHRYKKLCQQLKVIPSSSLLKQIGQNSVVIRNSHFSPAELKAAVTALVLDTELTQLELSGNSLKQQEAEYVTELLNTNRFLTHLVLSEDKLSGAGLETLVTTICGCKRLRSLDISGNGLCDKDSQSLCRLIEDTDCISELILHHNELGQCGGDLGNAIANNDTIRILNLSWNHIRGAGAVGFAKGIGKNTQLTNVNFSWNGFGFEGCVALSQALGANSTLLMLDLTNNRIHPPALLQLFNGVCKNKTLSSLSLGLNPIPAHLTSYILGLIKKWKHGNLKELDLQGIVVDREFNNILRQIQMERMFFVRFDKSRALQMRRQSMVDPSNLYNIDPMRILFFMKEHLRTIDLFLKIDSNKDGLLSREEMRYAFELEGYPISEKALDQVMRYLDVNKSGEVDLGEFFMAERQMRRDQVKEKQEEEARLQRLRREATENPISSSSLIQSVTPTYSQTFKKPPPRNLPKINK